MSPVIHCKGHRGAFMSERDYASYDHWKSWSEDSFFRFSPFEANYFLADFANVSLAHAKFLEIGFGSGTLLPWAKSAEPMFATSRYFRFQLNEQRKTISPCFPANLAKTFHSTTNFLTWLRALRGSSKLGPSLPRDCLYSVTCSGGFRLPE